MWSAVVAGTRRHRRVVLGGAVLGVLAWTGLALAVPAAARFPMQILLYLFVVVLAIVSIVANTRPGPAAFLVDPRTPAFRARPNDAQLLFALMILSVDSATTVGILSARHGAFGEMATWVLVSVMAALAALLVAVAWFGPGARLRPDGLVDSTGPGTLTVPWEALPPGGLPLPPPHAKRLTLTFARPELVRRRGLMFWSSVQTTGVSPVFLTLAIGFYLANPDRRPLIGTQAGYDELVRALTVPAPAQLP